MSISSRARLGAEMHCLSHDGLEVRTAQHWVDPDAPAGRPRSWLRLVLNGRPAQISQFTGARAHRELATYWASRVALFEPTRLTEDQMWSKLAEIGGIRPVACMAGHGSKVLPVAWPFCPVCGRDVRAVPAGFDAIAAASKRVIVVDRRKTQDHG